MELLHCSPLAARRWAHWPLRRLLLFGARQEAAAREVVGCFPMGLTVRPCFFFTARAETLLATCNAAVRCMKCCCVGSSAGCMGLMGLMRWMPAWRLMGLLYSL
ncbi:hypothetical protein Dimus_001448, partial [Dionaea muscipula]